MWPCNPGLFPFLPCLEYLGIMFCVNLSCHSKCDYISPDRIGVIWEQVILTVVVILCFRSLHDTLLLSYHVFKLTTLIINYMKGGKWSGKWITLSFIHTLRVHYAHAAANLNSGYSKYVKVARVHYFCTIALRTSCAVLTRAWASRRVDLRERRVDSFSKRVYILFVIFKWLFNLLKCLIYPRKFKGGICCGGHLVVTYGAELLYLRIFSFPSSVSNQ